MKATKFKQTEIGEIPEEREVVSLGQIVKLHYGKSLPERSRVDGNVPVYGSSGKTGFHNEPLVNEPGYIIGRKGTIGSIYYSKQPFYPIDTTYFVTKSDVKCDFKFFYYLLKTLDLDKLNSDSAVPGLNRDRAYSQKFSLPKSTEEQQQIASILSSLDDKIELNRRMNKTLEEIGKALFKRWFVDFEFPNENGEPYKSSGGEMVESELGMIPKGWKIKTLPEIAKIQKGLSYKGIDLVEEGNVALVGLKCFERGGGFRRDGLKYYAGFYKEEHLLKPGNLIVAMTDLTQEADVIGKPAIVPLIPHVETLVASLDLSLIKPILDGMDEFYLYLLLSRQESQEFLYGYANGSTVLHLSIKGLHEFKLLVPERSVLLKFQQIVQPIRKKITSLDIELNSLPAIRDLLLPRLMSGKIRVD